MAEYIEREAAIEYLENHKRIARENNTILAANEDAIIKFLREKCPAADVVEVVRCKDCKHYDPYDQTERFYCYDGIEGCLPNDFCSYGERREE